MKKAPFKLTLVLAGVIAASSAAAGPYDSWYTAVSDDDAISIADSFNSQSSVETTSTRTETQDNDWISSVRTSEDNDSSYSSDDDFTSTVTEDNDWISSVRTSEDNDSHYSSDDDYTSTVTEDNDYTHQEDNDVTTSEDNDVALDFLLATPTMTSHKFQDQDAGHQADTQVYGAASGHSVGVEGGTNLVSAGNEETVYYGPALVNENINQLPQNNVFIQGHSTAPISQANTFAGGDMGPKGIFGSPIGNTTAGVSGSVGQQSGASVDQAGDAANSIADPMSSVIR